MSSFWCSEWQCVSCVMRMYHTKGSYLALGMRLRIVLDYKIECPHTVVTGCHSFVPPMPQSSHWYDHPPITSLRVWRILFALSCIHGWNNILVKSLQARKMSFSLDAHADVDEVLHLTKARRQRSSVADVDEVPHWTKASRQRWRGAAFDEGKTAKVKHCRSAKSTKTRRWRGAATIRPRLTMQAKLGRVSYFSCLYILSKLIYPFL